MIFQPYKVAVTTGVAATVAGIRSRVAKLNAGVAAFTLPLATAGGTLLVTGLLLYGGLGAFLLGFVCMGVGVGYGMLAGVQVGTYQHAGPRRRAEGERAAAMAALAELEETNASLRAALGQSRQQAEQNAELAESHLAEVHRLRSEASHV